MLVVAFSALACAGPVDYPDWTVVVPEGARIIEYPHVPSEDRAERIDLRLDLVVGSEDGEPDGLLYRPFAIASDDDARVYVADVGNHQVLVFGADGSLVRSLGRQGQGPGEFVGPIGLTIAGPNLVVADEAKLSVWAMGGDHVRDIALESFAPAEMLGLADGTFVVNYPAIEEITRQQMSRFARWDQAGVELAAYPTLSHPISSLYPNADSDRPVVIGTGESWPSVVASREGDVYVTQSDEYQILAFDQEGAARWAMRVAMPRAPLFRRDIERTLESVRSRYPSATEAMVDWPAASFALSRLLIDGHGHLYVLPYAPPELEAQEREVDVYSRDGERLFAGLISLPAGAWTGIYAASGDFMFFLSLNAETEDWEVARYRLVEPFDESGQ